MLALHDAGASGRARVRVAAFASWPVAFGAALPLVVFLLEGRIGFGKADEGFLWYGVQRVVAGDVPLRDFQSYDIGRYYWSALWMWLADDHGLVVLRWSNALLAALTVAMATWSIASAWPRRPMWIALAAATVAVWMVPEYKAADSFAAVLLIVGLARWIGDPRARGAATFGVCLGVAATIGINHALYGTIAGLLAWGWMHWRGRRPSTRTLLALCVATGVGYLPVLLSFVFVPGFAAAFVDAIRVLVEAGTTNVDVPFPRLAAVFDPGRSPRVGALRESLLAAAFFVAPCFVVVCLAAARRTRASPAFVAATLAAIPYAHYVASCPEAMHAAISGLPLLIALWTFPRVGPVRRAYALCCVASLAFSLFLLLHAYAGYPALRGRPLVAVRVLGDTLRVAPDAERELDLVHSLTDEFPQRAFLATHDWPGAYAVVDRRAPNREIYALFPARAERQRREIARIVAARPAFVILTTGRAGEPVDGLEKTHPLIRDYIDRCFVARALPARFAALPVAVYVAERDCPAT